MSETLESVATEGGVGPGGGADTPATGACPGSLQGIGPKFIKHGSPVFYRRSDVLEWLDCNAIQRTGDPRQQR